MSIYKNINETLAKQGINTMTGNMYDFIAIWKQWYRGNVNDFHNYNIKMADGNTRKCERLTLNMAKKISEDFSKLLWTERTKIELDTKAKTDRLWKILDSKMNNFSINFPKFLEKGFALGTGLLVQYKYKDKTLIDYIDADLIIPFEYNNSYISGVISLSGFIRKENEKDIHYTNLTIHKYDGTKYTRENQLYKSESASELGEKILFSSMFPDVKPYVKYETDTPPFQIFRPNIANNLDFSNPMGISIYANHIDKMKSIDIKYDSFCNEFITGVKRILVDRTALKSSPKVNETTGEIDNVMYFDSNDRTYVAVNGMENQPVKEIDFNLRTQHHIESINADLNYLSAGVGLGQNYYDFNGQSAAKTATEVISENSDTYRSKENHQIIIRDVLYDLVKSICFLEGIKTKFIQITFDDSIVEDKNADKRQALIEYNAGLIDKVEYFMVAYGLDEEEAIKKVQTIDERNQVEYEKEPPLE